MKPLQTAAALTLALGLLGTPALADGDGEAAYTTRGRGPHRFDLVTQTGRYEVQLNDGCEAGPNMQVVVRETEQGKVLRPVRSDADCIIVQQILIDTYPCETNGAGECDICRVGIGAPPLAVLQNA